MSFDSFRAYTQARILLGNAGAGLPTKAWLDFSLHHAHAVDAIAIPWHIDSHRKFFHDNTIDINILNTAVRTREEYLLRPDLGRCLRDDAIKNLSSRDLKDSLLILISNGLSSVAMHNHLENFLSVFLERISTSSLNHLAKNFILIENGRVGLIDAIGEICSPLMGLTIIGERPGLSSPDSLAVYLTYQPRVGRLDAERNCISNIRPPHGLGYEDAADKLLYLIENSLARKISGVMLKDESDSSLQKINSQP